MAIPSCHCDHERSVVGGNLILPRDGSEAPGMVGVQL